MKLVVLGSGTSVPHAQRSSSAYKPMQTHLELVDAMRLAQLAEPRRVVLTHLYPEWDGVDLVGEAKALWSGETIAAVDGLRLEV